MLQPNVNPASWSSAKNVIPRYSWDGSWPATECEALTSRHRQQHWLIAQIQSLLGCRMMLVTGVTCSRYPQEPSRHQRSSLSWTTLTSLDIIFREIVVLAAICVFLIWSRPKIFSGCMLLSLQYISQRTLQVHLTWTLIIQHYINKWAWQHSNFFNMFPIQT